MDAYDVLKKRFREQRPALTGALADHAFLNEILWALYRDPADAASVVLGYENPPLYDVEVTFEKAAESFTSTFHVTDDDGRPMHTIETRYSLAEGIWKSEETSRWQRS